MDYVYVVTYGLKGANEGQFYTEMAYMSVADAEAIAMACMVNHEGLSKFVQVGGGGLPAHVVKRWDSDKMTVWLEKLEVQE